MGNSFCGNRMGAGVKVVGLEQDWEW